jgi:hypothetical protein
MKNYKIYDGYKNNLNPNHHDDRLFTDDYQLDVYLFARDIMNNESLSNIIDIGCGSGYKLINYLGQFETIGIETEPCYSMLKTKYPNRNWINSGEPEKSFSDESFTTDVVLCCDVIEHIIDPTQLINFIKKINFKYLIISTPDREILKKISMDGDRVWSGPPLNPAHVREWSYEEFKEYLEENFQIVSGYHSKKQQECMYFLCKNQK